MTTNYTLKNPFGLRDNKIVVIGDLDQFSEKGLKCFCVCPACKRDFVARMGEERTWHFAHSKNASCKDEYALMVGIYMFIANVLNGSLILPPCYLRLKENKRADFYANYINCSEKTEIPDDVMKDCFEVSSVKSDNVDSTICFSPAQNFLKFSARHNDGTYEAFVDSCLLIVNNHLVPIDDYSISIEKALPTALCISGINLPVTHIVLSFFNSKGCTPKAFSERELDNYERCEDIACLKFKVDLAFFAESSSVDRSENKADPPLKPNLTSALLADKILSPSNMIWENVPQKMLQKAKNYMRQKYEKMQLENLYEYYQKQWNLEKQNKDNFKENNAELKKENEHLRVNYENEKKKRTALEIENARLATQFEKERQAHATDNSSEKTVALIKAEFQRQLATKDEELAAKNEEISDLKRQLFIQNYKSSSTADSKSDYEKQLDEKIEELNRKYPHPTYRNLPPKHLYYFTSRYIIFFCEHCEKWTYEPSSIEDKSPPSYIPLKQFCKDCL